MFLISLPPKDAFFAVNPPLEITEVSIESMKIFFWKSIGFFAQLIFPFQNVYSVSASTIPYCLTGITLLIILLFNLPKRIARLSFLSIFVFYLFHVFGYSPFWWHRGSASLVVCLSAYLCLASGYCENRKVPILISHAILSLQIMGSLLGLGNNFNSDFSYSNAGKAANFIESICGMKCIVVAENDLSASAISAYLPSAKFFYANRGEYGSFTSWRNKHYGKLTNSWNELLAKSVNVSPDVFVLPLNSSAVPPTNFRIKTYRHSIWGDDYQIVYLP
jgi:hypothetical protein